MGSFPTSVAQRLLKQLFIAPWGFAHGTASIPLYNTSGTVANSSGITASNATAGAVSLYVGLLWHFSTSAGGPAATGGFKGGNGFVSAPTVPAGIYDNHIKAVGNWGAVTGTNDYTAAGIACTLASSAAGNPQYSGRLAELTNGGYTGRQTAGITGGNGLTRQPLVFNSTTTFDDTAAAASPAVQSNHATTSGSAIAFGTYSGTVQGTTFDGASMAQDNCSIVGFFITPIQGSATVGSWGQGANAAAAAAAVDANRPWIIAYGQLSSSRSINVGDQPQFTATAITITLA